MPKYGMVVAVLNPEIQTHLTADAAIGATVLMVESTHQFNNEPGDMVAVGAQAAIEILSSDEETITLASGLPAAAIDGDPVTLVRGGQRATFWDAEVDFGEEETVPVPIGFDQREKWPAGEYDPPVPVLVSDDLAAILDAPGRTPSIDGTLTYVPASAGAKGSNQSLAHNTWTTLLGWFTFKLARVTFDAGTGIFTVLEDGIYDFRLGVTFDTNSTNQRAIRMRYYSTTGVDLGPSRMVRFPSDGFTSLETAQYRGLFAGESVSFEAWQNSGVALDILGSNVFTSPPVTDCAIRWVGPL